MKYLSRQPIAFSEHHLPESFQLDADRIYPLPRNGVCPINKSANYSGYSSFIELPETQMRFLGKEYRYLIRGNRR